MFVILEITGRRMASVEECEKLRGEAEVKLLKEIQKLRKACEVEAPNMRLVADLVAGLDIARDNLFGSHVDLVIEMNALPHEDRFTQFIDRWVDATEEVRAVAEVILEAVDEDGVPNPQQDGRDAPRQGGDFDVPRLLGGGDDLKLSEEVNKQCATDYVQQCTDEVTT